MTPALVLQARHLAKDAQFTLSSDDRVGRLLAVLAGTVRQGGAILELGTGTGVGTAWLCHGPGSRRDVSIVSVERDPARAQAARSMLWPSFVRLVEGDALEYLAVAPKFDLIFADAPGGKWFGLDRTIAALAPHGLLVVDDMDLALCLDDEDRTMTNGVRETLMLESPLCVVDIEWATGVMLCALHGEPACN